MAILKSRWLKTLLFLVIVLTAISGSAYVYYQSKIEEIHNTLRETTISSKSFFCKIPFEYVGNWIVIQVKIKGSESSYDFIFDTGGQTVFSDYFIHELSKENYEIIQLKTDTSKHAFRDHLVSLDNLQIGDVTFNKIGAIVVDNDKYEMLNCISPWGIIGHNIIQACCFQIDYEKKEIILTDLAEKLPYYKRIEWIQYKTFEQESPVIPFKINDKAGIDLLFDTGFNGGISLTSQKIYDTISNTGTHKISPYLKKPVIKITDTKNNRDYNGFWYTTDSVRFGNNILLNQVIDIHDGDEASYTGLLGNQILDNYIVSLDYARNKIGFIKNNLTEKKQSSKSFGLNFIPARTKLYVKSIYKNSDAHKQGILVGDEVFSLNGELISGWLPDRFCKIYRDEYQLIDSNAEFLDLEIIRQDKISRYKLKKHDIFR